jgi:AraC-like DNA-binding protein
MDNPTLTLTQALQITALTPTLFIIILLARSSRHHNTRSVVPLLYFITLACAFVWPLRGLLPEGAVGSVLSAIILTVRSMNSAVSFLLMVQLQLARVPPPPYWLVLTLPIIGGSSFIYAGVLAQEVCVHGGTICVETETAQALYNIFSALLIFLLFMMHFFLQSGQIAEDDVHRRHKYWLILSLLALNVLLSCVGLVFIMGWISSTNREFVATMIRLAFIYLVLTSVFRVFYAEFALGPIGLRRKTAVNTEQDKALVDKIREALEQQHAYREMGLSRASLAERLDIGEHQLSRLVNTYFNQSFSELVNSYRISEAKQRLSTELGTQITVIAFEVGYSSIASFNRVFRQIVGLSPTEFRAAQVAGGTATKMA